MFLISALGRMRSKSSRSAFTEELDFSPSKNILKASLNQYLILANDNFLFLFMSLSMKALLFSALLQYKSTMYLLYFKRNPHLSDFNFLTKGRNISGPFKKRGYHYQHFLEDRQPSTEEKPRLYTSE